MPIKKPAYERTPEDSEGYAFRLLPEAEVSAFNPSVFGVGDLGAETTSAQVLAAIYDLQSFTAFCNQIDSHLIIPEFLDHFIDWLVCATREEAVESVTGGMARLWEPLPCFSKFMGDGVLFLWDTSEFEGAGSYSNLTRSVRAILHRYRSEFLPMIRQRLASPPPDLRCGVARGQVMAIGDGHDFVGSCINVASRLQKYSSLQFVLSRRGLHLTPRALEGLALRKIDLRGIGEELVYVEEEPLAALPPEEQALFRLP